MRSQDNYAVILFLLGFFIRFVAVVVTTFTELNPESTSDVVAFGETAASIAEGSTVWQPLVLPFETIGTYHLWGSYLAPFYLLPGPSGLFARTGMALLGAFAIYNVYLLARHYHSTRAGIIASLPMVFYPSFVIVQSTLLRDAFILAGITYVVRVVVLPPRRYPEWVRYPSAAGILYIIYSLRPENGIIYAIAIIAGTVAQAYRLGYLPEKAIILGFASSIFGIVVMFSSIRDRIEMLATIRELRATGRTVYLQGTIPDTIAQFIAFSWLGAMYFLYAPFPWMVETIPDVILGIEGAISLGISIAAIPGVRHSKSNLWPITVALGVGLIIGVILYGVGTANFGTGLRHRQMFLWVIFLFGGTYLADRVRVNVHSEVESAVG